MTLLLTYTKQRECIECGQLDLLFDSFKKVNGHHYCSTECIEKSMFKCSNCHDYHDLEYKMTDQNDEVYCQDCYDELYEHCTSCGEETDKDDIHYIEGSEQWLCDDCYDTLYTECHSCNEVIRQSGEGTYTIGRHSYCETCYQDRFSCCESCSEAFPNVEGHDTDNGFLCDSCYDEKCKPNIQASATFNMTMGIKRNYGIEIECCTPDNFSYPANDYVDVTDDGSISPEGDDTSCEVRIGVLQGDSGLELLDKVCQRLDDKEAYVNKSTGLHVHIDATDIKEKERACIQSLAFAFDKVIFSLMPKSRRENTYCNALPDRYRRTQGTFYHLGSRYHGFNTESLGKHSTFEFRYHSGTTDYKKIYHWVLLCLHLVEYGQGFFWTTDQFKPSIGNLIRLLDFIKIPKHLHQYYLDRYKKFNVLAHSDVLEEVC